MRQRILFIILLAVVVLLVWTITRPRPRSRVSRVKRVVAQKAEGKPKAEKPLVTPEVKKEPAPKEPVAVVSKEPVIPKPPVRKPEIEKKEEVVEVWGKDPFIRDWVLATELRDLKLKAVTLSGDKAYALINDQILGKGEIILGKKIVKIEKDRVILEQGGREFSLFLGE